MDAPEEGNKSGRVWMPLKRAKRVAGCVMTVNLDAPEEGNKSGRVCYDGHQMRRIKRDIVGNIAIVGLSEGKIRKGCMGELVAVAWREQPRLRESG